MFDASINLLVSMPTSGDGRYDDVMKIDGRNVNESMNPTV